MPVVLPGLRGRIRQFCYVLLSNQTRKKFILQEENKPAVTAFILERRTGRINDAAQELLTIRGITEAHSVAGEYDLTPSPG